MFADLYRTPVGIRTKRVSSYDRSGGNNDRVKILPGETFVMADLRGSGVIRHIWITLYCEDPMLRRNAVLRMYWDGQPHPSVEAPLGDFFGQGFGEEYNFMSLPLAAAPKGGRALNCYFPMPFRQSARITIENQSDKEISYFYFYCDYEEHDNLEDDALYFHAWWNREITKPKHGLENDWAVYGKEKMPHNLSDEGNYLFAEIEGRGKFVGINYYVDNPTTLWYGEGDDMFRVDGEDFPFSLLGTGTEDFFNASWCPKEVYMHPFFGYARVNNESGYIGRTHCYRFLMDDPIYFSKSLRASIEHGHANNLTLDISSVSYWYQTLPNKPFPLMRSKLLRQNMTPITGNDILKWREAWVRESVENVWKMKI